jgi:hypothetical protein
VICVVLPSDFDHDENADVAIGEPFRNIGADSNAGRVHIMYGGDAGLSALAYEAFDQDTPGVPGATGPGDQFGYAVASGDFDDDCDADLAISAPSDGANGLTILKGSPSGLTTTGAQTFAIDFGVALATGDFDDDGDDDLAVGGEGRVAILEGGGALGLVTAGTYTQDTAGVPGTDETGDHWGNALAIGDFDGDNWDDLAIGAWGENIGSSSSKVNAGSVTILRGSASGITTAGAELWTQDTAGVPGTAESDHFGEALAAGELDNSGEVDLIVGSPEESIGSDTRTGSIIILNGSAGGGLTASGAKSFHQDTSGVPGSNEDGDHFGDALTVGEFNGDGYEDVVVGASDENVGSIVNAGSVTVLYSNGPDGGLVSDGSKTFTQDTSGVMGSAEASDHFGASMHASTITGMGHSDLLIGVPSEDTHGATNNGAFNLLLGGGGSGITVTGDEYWSLGHINGTEQDGAQFARSLG